MADISPFIKGNFISIKQALYYMLATCRKFPREELFRGGTIWGGTIWGGTILGRNYPGRNYSG